MKFIEKCYERCSWKMKTAVLLLLFLLSAILIQTRWGLHVDYLLTAGIYDGLHWYIWRSFFVFLSIFGFGSVIGFFYVSIILLVKERNLAAVWYVLFTVVLQVVVMGLKNFFWRVRPYEVYDSIVAFSTSMLDSFSFPSAHSAMAFFTAYFLARRFNYDFGRKFMIMGLAALIALSRVYIGVHYFIDVVAGAAIGLLIGRLAEYCWCKWVVDRNKMIS